MKELGQKIREARESRNLTIEMIHNRTKIPVDTLTAIESGDVTHLPITYYRVFVRNISKEIGLDPELLLKEYNARTQHVQEELDRVQEEKKPVFKVGDLWERYKKVIMVSIFILFCVIVVVLSIIYWPRPFVEPDSSGIKAPVVLIDSVDVSGSDSLETADGAVKQTIRNIEPIEVRPDEQLDVETSEQAEVRSYEQPEVKPDEQAEVSPYEQPEVETVEPEPESTHIIIGYITEEDLLTQMPVYRRNRNGYQPDPTMISEIRKIDPSLDLECFFGSWDSHSENIVPQLLRILHATRLSDVSLTLFGVDRNYKDKGGFAERRQVQGVPAIIIFSTNRELGRIVGQSSESLELSFLRIIQKIGLLEE